MPLLNPQLMQPQNSLLGAVGGKPMGPSGGGFIGSMINGNSQQQSPAPIGVKAAMPSANTKKPTNTIAPKFQAPPSQQSTTAGGPQQSSGTQQTQPPGATGPGIYANGQYYAPGSLPTPDNTISSTPPPPDPNANANTQYTTPSGAVVTGGGQTVSAPQSQPSDPRTGLIGQMVSGTQQIAPQIAQTQGAIQDLRTELANKEGILQNTPGELNFMTGRSNQLQQLEAAKEGALQNKLTAQEQQLATVQGAQNNAISALSPSNQFSQVPYGTQLIGSGGQNAQQGGAIGGAINGQQPGGSLNPINNIQSIAQQVISEKISPSQGYAMGGNVSNFQGALNAEIQKQSPGFNTGTAQGKYDASQTNTQNNITAPQQAYQGTYQAGVQGYQQTNTQLNNVSGLGALAVNVGGAGNINPFDAKFANQTLAQFRTQLSSPDQTKFNQAMASFQGAVSSLLGGSSNVTPTQISDWTTQISNGSMQLSTLKDIYNQSKNEGAIRLGNYASQAVDSQAAMKGSNPPGMPGTMAVKGQTWVLHPDGSYYPVQ